MGVRAGGDVHRRCHAALRAEHKPRFSAGNRVLRLHSRVQRLYVSRITGLALADLQIKRDLPSGRSCFFYQVAKEKHT